MLLLTLEPLQVHVLVDVPERIGTDSSRQLDTGKALHYKKG